MQRPSFFVISVILLCIPLKVLYAESKYDKESERALSGKTKYESEFTYARTNSPEAMKLYKMGRYLVDSIASQDIWERIEEGISKLQKALELDPTFAAPHISLADAYWYQAVIRSSSFPKSEEEISLLKARAIKEYENAIGLDSSNPIPHLRLGEISRDRAERVRHFKRVLELDLDQVQDVSARDKAGIADTEGKVDDVFRYLEEDLKYVPIKERCSFVRNPGTGTLFGWDMYRMKYPEYYKRFETKVCEGRGLPEYKHPPGE
jgi:tetratricopeptide (TPR) repeat protein